MPRIRAWPGRPPAAPEEYPTTLHVNGRELVTVQTTPVELQDWAIGFLYAEGFIRGLQDVLDLRTDEERGQVWAQLARRPEGEGGGSGLRHLTSGCGRGITFASPLDAAAVLQPVRSPVRVSHEQLVHFLGRMQLAAVRYAATGGMHVAGLFSVSTGAMIVREDIGRHNAVDKAIGAALRAGWDPADLVLLTSGRISVEMCIKAARFGIGLVGSRTAATDLAVQLADQLGMGIVGYLRRPRGWKLYTGAERLTAPAPVAIDGALKGSGAP